MIVRKTALITGAAQRIGRAIALDLAAHGYAVAVHCNRSRDAAEAVAAEARALGVEAGVVAADLADEDAVAGLVAAAADAIGPVGVLINNASTFERDDALGATRASWDLHMEVNLRAPFVLSQALAKALPEGDAGAIVNIVDQRVWNLNPHYMTYTLSKAGLWTLTQTLALALAPAIRVNAIGPGPVLKNVRQSDADFAAQYEALPLRRAVGPDEIARGVRFILDSASMTGHWLALDAGEHLGYAHPKPGEAPPD